MRLRELLPYGDREARKAWGELVSRDVLGAVVIGTSSGKLVEWSLNLLILLGLSESVPPVWDAVAHILAWSVTIWIGVWVFVYWHRITEQAEEVAEEAQDKVSG